MENVKVIIVSAVVVAVGLTGYALFVPTPSEKVVREIINEVKVGAIPGNEINAEEVVINGLNLVAYNKQFNTGSTTLCSFDTISTSTLIKASAIIDTASTAALYFEWGKATTPEATTTSLGASALGASTKGTLLASSSASLFDVNGEYGPGDFLNLKYGGATCTDGAACTSLRGTCNGLFIR